VIREQQSKPQFVQGDLFADQPLVATVPQPVQQRLFEKANS
jgi:hypothetical protein